MNKTSKMISKNVLSLILILISLNVIAQKTDYSIDKLENRLDSLILNVMESDHIPGATFIIVKDGKTILKKGYGYTSLGKNAKLVSPDSTIFRIGSITKTFTVTALLQLKDKNKINLDTDVNTYLKTVKVPATYKKPVTPFHLMTHSAGFDELRGRVVYKQNKQISQNTFLKNKLVRLREPGVVSAYSTFGIALAGLLVEDISGLSLEAYMNKNIWTPLDMSMTSIEIPKDQENCLSIGYEYENGINIPQPWEWYHTYPASSINSTATDMAKYMQMHLNLGTFNNHKILNKTTALSMQQQQLSVLPQVDGFAFGLYERNHFGLKTYNHGGDMLGYSTFMTLVPEKNMGIFVANHHEGTNLRKKVIEIILEHFAKNPEMIYNPSRIKTNVNKFAGNYRWMSTCKTCPKNHPVQTYSLTANDDNTLSGFNRTFYQIEPLLFKSYDGKRTMGFIKNKKGDVVYMSLGNINAFEKVN